MAIQMVIQRDSFWGKGGQRSYGEDGTPSDNLLTILRGSDCSKPHDKVFAAISITDRRHKKVIYDDYGISLAGVYGSVTRHDIISTRTLDALHFVAPNMSPDMPTWVADFRLPTVSSEISYVTRLNELDAAGGRLVSTDLIDNVAAKSNPITLRLRGRHVGKIEYTGTKLQVKNPYEKTLGRLKRPALNMRSNLHQYQMVQMVIDQWRSLCAVKFANPYPSYTTARSREV